MTEPVNLKTVARLHNLTTMMHIPVYFSEESTTAYEAVGLPKRSHYFASRAAALGPVSAEVVEATFYNFNPALVHQAMDGAWEAAGASQVQIARWRAIKSILDTSVRPSLRAADISEAVSIAQTCVASMSFAGRPLAAGNAAVMSDLASSDMAADELVKLWQLITVIREWRGDAHIALLIAESLSPAECTVISYAQRPAEFLKKTRAWSEDEWGSAVASMADRSWLNPDGTFTELGDQKRLDLEERTNQLSVPMWHGMDDGLVNRLGDLLDPAFKALRQAGLFTAVGLPPK